MSFMNLPVPKNISYLWNSGSIISLCLFIQILSGLFLTFYYSNNLNAFSSIIHIDRDVNFGWLIRSIHANGASMFFCFLYIHIGRGLLNKSFLTHVSTWLVGMLMFFTSMAIAFLGYVLPWGQMSLWGATVITNLLSTLPYLGEDLTQWVWGGFSVNFPTLTRFFSLHFIGPFFILSLLMIHLLTLHISGSSNPLGLTLIFDSKIQFNPYFFSKDLLGFSLFLWSFILLSLFNPFFFMDSENFMIANPLVTPTHIQPEWYYLFAYAILRAIPNKLGGVIMLIMSILVLIFIPFLSHFKPSNHQSKNLFFMFTHISFVLTWIGANSVEYPYIILSQFYTLLYFSYFMMI